MGCRRGSCIGLGDQESSQAVSSLVVGKYGGCLPRFAGSKPAKGGHHGHLAKECDGLYLQISTIKVGSRKEELFWPSRPSPCYNIVDGLANVALWKDWSKEKGKI